MFTQLASQGHKLAEAFLESGQDVFTMTTDVAGNDVSITVSFAPKAKKVEIRPEGVWNMFTSRMSEKTLNEI